METITVVTTASVECDVPEDTIERRIAIENHIGGVVKSALLAAQMSEDRIDVFSETQEPRP